MRRPSCMTGRPAEKENVSGYPKCMANVPIQSESWLLGHLESAAIKRPDCMTGRSENFGNHGFGHPVQTVSRYMHDLPRGETPAADQEDRSKEESENADARTGREELASKQEEKGGSEKIDRQLPQIRKQGKEARSAYDLCEEAKKRYDFVVVDDELFYFENSSYHKVTEKTLRRLLAEILPEYRKDIAIHHRKRFYEILKDCCGLETYSRLELSEAYSDYISVQNGIFRISTQELLEGDCGAICLVTLDAEVLENGSLETPVFDAFVEQASGGDWEVQNRMLDFFAIMLAPDIKTKSFYVLGTAPNSGKSTLLDFIAGLYPRDVVGRMLLHKFAGTFATGSLADYYINISGELETAELSPRVVGELKTLTGERYLQSEKKGKQSEPKVCQCRLVMATNTAITVRIYDEAFYNRMEIVPFVISVSLEDQDRNLLKKLSEERDAIVTKLLLRLTDLASRDFCLTPCFLAEQMKKEWMNWRPDTVKEFLDECCLITNSLEDCVAIPKLYEAYCDYAAAFGERPEPKKTLTKKVRESVCHECRDPNNVRYIKGSGNHARVLCGLQLKKQEAVSDKY